MAWRLVGSLLCAQRGHLAYASAGFCHRYFLLGKLKDTYNEASNDNSKKWDLRNYENRARPWITTMMRIKTIGKWPGKPLIPKKTKFPNQTFKKFVSSGAQARFLSKNADYFDEFTDVKTWANPDNWSWFALAQYVTYRLGNYPSWPQTPDDL